MPNIRYALMRLFAVPFALLFLCDWILLPADLQMLKATDQTVSARFGDFKQGDVVQLFTEGGGELRVWCGNAGRLCAELRRTDTTAAPGATATPGTQGTPPAARKLRVWLQDPGLFHGHWVVAAQERNRYLSSPEDVQPEYQQLKTVMGALTLLLVAGACAMWYFAPGEREQTNAR